MVFIKSFKDFHLKTAHLLCAQAETIFAEDLNTVGLNRGMLRKECIDASFGQFLDLLKWVCWKRGNYFERVDPRGTSQTCPECGATVQKPLSQREHFCPECNYRAHRDRAAAQMVRLRGWEKYPWTAGNGNRLLLAYCRVSTSSQISATQECLTARLRSPRRNL